MHNDCMSLENMDGKNDVHVQPLPWGSAYVDCLFSPFNAFKKSCKSMHAHRQLRVRQEGTFSRKPPPTTDVPPWALLLTDDSSPVPL